MLCLAAAADVVAFHLIEPIGLFNLAYFLLSNANVVSSCVFVSLQVN